MIKVDKNNVDLQGSGTELFTELGIAACEIIIASMEHGGYTKETAIKLLYKSLQLSIEGYERLGEL